MTTYPEIQLTIRLDNVSKDNESDRNNLRKLAIREFTKERAGEGKGEMSTNYKYIVETLKSGDRIYITRPAFNKLGFDFLIHVENHKFLNGKDNPKHDDLINDIKLKASSSSLSKKILNDIEKVYRCYEPNKEIVDYSLYNGLVGFPFDLILKISKWFFIEQDIRYWNYSGRNMLMNRYKEILNNV
jgi:hypothetical protein